MRPFLLLILLALTNLHAAADWSRFRGPNGSGVSAAAGLPVQFGPQQNVIWKIPVPAGDSSPVFAGKRLYLTEDESIARPGLLRRHTGAKLQVRLDRLRPNVFGQDYFKNSGKRIGYFHQLWRDFS